MLLNHLNRNKDKYNPYTLDIDEKNNYIVEFKDSKNVLQKIEIFNFTIKQLYFLLLVSNI